MVKRVSGLVFLFSAATILASAPALSAPKPTPSPAAKKAPVAKKLTMADLAPADEYFGPLKLSILGIRNTIRDLGLRYAVNHDANATLASAALTESAIRDWAKRYPRDTQLPRNIYFLEHLYAMVESDQGHQKATVISTWLLTSYGTTGQAKMLRKEMEDAKNATPVPAASPPASSDVALPPANGAPPSPTPSPARR